MVAPAVAPVGGRERLQKRSTGFVIKSESDAAQGIVKAVVNVFGIIDTQGDIIQKGAYTKTLKERKNNIRTKILDNHQTASVLNIVAKANDIYEVDRAELPPEVLEMFPKATGGLVCEMQFMMADPTNISQGVFERINFGASNEYSIGLEIVEQTFTTEKDDDGHNVRVRNIKQLALFDVSPVIWGANEGTVTTDVKALTHKAVTGFGDLPLAARDRAWDG